MAINHLAVVNAAANAYAIRNNLAGREKRPLARRLGQHGVFSLNQIAAILGTSTSVIHEEVTKTDRTGGRLNPDTLGLIRDLLEQERIGQPYGFFAAEILRAGTSPLVLERLTGIPALTLRQAARAHEREQQAVMA